MRKKKMSEFTTCGCFRLYAILMPMKKKHCGSVSVGPTLKDAPKVLIIISLVHASARNFFRGILQYVDEHTNWDIRILPEPNGLSGALIDELERNGYAGILLATSVNIDFDRLNRSSIPLAACEDRPELSPHRKNVVHVNVDGAACATAGAKHLLAQGNYAVYGFVRGRFDMEWSARRQKAFVHTVRQAGAKVVCYDPPPGSVQESDLSVLRDWLASLPKPAAIMADYDCRAAQVIAACHDGGMSVPRDVSVIGVDNDTFYALHTRPPLSSVEPGHSEAGYRMAAELDKLIRAKKPSRQAKHVAISPKGVIARESTRAISSSTVLVRRIVTFIEANVTSGIKVTDVVQHLGCSRRIAELRFKEAKGQTIADFIMDCRLEEVKRRLSASAATVAEVAAECAFKTAAHLSHLFKRRLGLSIRDWRHQA